MTTLIISGAYGEDYASESEAIIAWINGKDFRIRNINIRGTYVSCREVDCNISFINIRYNDDVDLTVIEVIKDPNLRCGYCTEKSIAWIDWKTIGRPKGAPVCKTHLYGKYYPDNFNEYPTIKWYRKDQSND